VLSDFLFGVTPTDASTFVAVLLLFSVVAIVSVYIPARKTTSGVVLRFL
jgi:hypothetical protein